MVDTAITRAVLTVETPPLQALASRAGWKLTLNLDASPPVILIEILQHRTGERYLIQGEFDGYKEVPPAWDFLDPDTGEAGTLAAYPSQPQPTPGGGAPLFIAANPRPRVICMPCNRLAFGSYGGPHGDWTLANWMSVQPAYPMLSDMVSRINTEIQASGGRWGPRQRSDT